MADDVKFAFWTNLLRELETEPRKADFVRGVSGLEHPIIAAGVDDARRRLLLVSGEHDARSAAIAQLDIQRAIESVQVVVIRPIAINLAPFAKQVVDFLGGPTVAPAQWRPRGLKPCFFLGACRGAEAPLFHGCAWVRDAVTWKSGPFRAAFRRQRIWALAPVVVFPF